MNETLLHKVMVIDDNEIDRFVHHKLLKHHQICDEVVECDGGREALDYIGKTINEGGKEIDLILLDLMMPEMDGFAFLSHYKNLRSKLSKAPMIFMLSSTEDDSDLERVRANELIIKLLHKPLSPQSLLHAIKIHS